MCERVPARFLPPRSLPRRALLAGAAAAAMGACMPIPRRRRAPPAPAAPACPPLARAPRTRAPRWRVYRRAQWGAEPLKDNHDPMGAITRITLHHTAELPGMGTRTDLELVKGVQDFHQGGRGWADIGYHWLIGRDGNVYEGRALTVQGAHAGGGNNAHNLGISVMGDFTQALPPARQLATVQGFLAQQLAKYRIPSGRLYGHREFKPTECPGSALYAWLTAFRAARSAPAMRT